MKGPGFAEVYKEWSSYVYSLAYRLAGNKADAEDLAQEVFLRVHRFLGEYKGGSLKGWLYKIVTNTFYLMVEREKKKPIPVEDDHLLLRLGKDPEPTAAEALLTRETQKEVHGAIAMLPPEYKTAVVLADLEGMTYQEISEILSVPIGTVRSRIARARGILKEKLLKKGGKNQP